MDQTVGMALHAVGEFDDACLEMRLVHLIFVVRVAVGAGECRIRLRVAGRTVDLTLAAMIEREIVL